MARLANLGDVAKAAKLSSAAVSRHLNGSLRLPPETVRRIEIAIASLNYRPNAHARSLSRGKSEMIGLLLPEIANPFFSQLAASVEAAADANGLGVMLCTSFNKPSREIDYLARLRGNLVDGLLLATNHADDGTLANAIEASPGVVLLDEDVADTSVPKVFSDNEQGGALAAAHLLEFGHRAFAYVGGPPDLMSARERGAGFTRVVREADRGHSIAGLPGDYSRQHGERSAADILDHHSSVTAIFAGSDEILIGLLTVLRARRVQVGRDISIVTFDDAGPLALLDPPITAIRQPIAEIGRVALDCVLNGRAGRRVERLPVRLVARASVAPPAGSKAKRKVSRISSR